MPAMLVSKLTIQPIISLEEVLVARRAPHTAGTIKYEKTNNTPAISTELVTTAPKVA